jgi:hypothetical protein
MASLYGGEVRDDGKVNYKIMELRVDITKII